MKENTDQSTNKPVYKIKNKLVSGRLWLTSIAGLSFLIFVCTVCYIMVVKRDIITGSDLNGMLNILLLIISNVMTFYFTKNRDEYKTNSNDVISKLVLEQPVEIDGASAKSNKESISNE